VLQNGKYFGNLCAIDPHPCRVSDARTVSMFTLFAEMISLQLAAEERHGAIDAALLRERATAELREEFIAVLGHDLRTPLNAVGITAQILENHTDEPELLTLGHRLRVATGRMSRLIEDLMDYARSRLGSGIGVTLAQTDDLTTALSDVVAELRQANPGSTVIENIVCGGSIYCDRGRVQQLLSNLLSNAITHGGSELPVRVEAAVEGETLVLAVTNGGEPIAPENLSKIFDPYWRLSSGKRSGLGLGLHICSQIVKEHGGSLRVSSSAEAGTIFTVRLPTITSAEHDAKHALSHEKTVSQIQFSG
jgi:signal transduction histidine kinase